MGWLCGTALMGLIVAALPPAPILVSGVFVLAFSRVPWPGRAPGNDTTGAQIGRILAGWGIALLAVGALGYRSEEGRVGKECVR